jgi:ferric-dicitrate binding protein FerR (iron transport regulator)
MQELTLYRLEELTSALLSLGLTEPERDELADLLKDTENRKAFRELYSLELISGGTVPRRSVEEACEKIMASVGEHTEIPAPKPMRRITVWRGVAAAAVLAVVAAGSYLTGSGGRESLQGLTNIYAPPGSKSVVELPDGSTVTLNAGTTIQYSGSFGVGDREVKLTGEAYFDVEKGKRPFLVSAKNTKVRVFGTEFNVKAYADEDFVETTLVEGAVSIIPDVEHDRREIELKPDQRAVVSGMAADKVDVSLFTDVNTLLYTSWKDPKWIIQSETLAGIARKLSRKYDVNIKIDNAQLGEYKFTGSFKDETIQQTLDIIKNIAPVDYTWVDDTIRIYEDSGRRRTFETSIKE